MPKISALPALTAAADGDEIPINDISDSGGTTKKMTLTKLKEYLQALVGWITTAMVADGAITAAKRSQMVTSGVIAGSTLGSTGNKAITGVGFTPKLVLFHVIPSASTTVSLGGHGGMTATSQWASWFASDTAGTTVFGRNGYTNRCVAWGSAGSSTGTLQCSYVSMDSNGFTINVNNASSTFDVAYVAIG